MIQIYVAIVVESRRKGEGRRGRWRGKGRRKEKEGGDSTVTYNIMSIVSVMPTLGQHPPQPLKKATTLFTDKLVGNRVIDSIPRATRKLALSPIPA